MKYVVKYVGAKDSYREAARLMDELRSARRELRDERRKVHRVCA